MGKHRIDVQTWPRREHFEFFGRMDDPYFGLTAKADFTKCQIEARRDGASFFLYSLHKILRAANAIAEFRCRVEGGEVYEYDLVGVSSTIGREDGSFGFGYFPYVEDRAAFVRIAAAEVERVKNASGLCLDVQEDRRDLIYYSSLPWIDFSDLKHPGSLSGDRSVPRITTGRLVPSEGRLLMSVSVHLNHGLADGRHVAQFFRLLEML